MKCLPAAGIVVLGLLATPVPGMAALSLFSGGISVDPSIAVDRAAFRTRTYGSGVNALAPLLPDLPVINLEGQQISDLNSSALTSTVVSVAGPITDLTNGGARYDASRGMIVTGPNTTGAQLLGLELINNNGQTITGFSLYYEVATLIPHAQGSNAADSVRGIGLSMGQFGTGGAFYPTAFSFTEQNFTTPVTMSPGVRPGESLYFVFMDDNGPSSGLTATNSEGLYGLRMVRVNELVLVPEPSAAAVLGALAGCGLLRRKRRRRVWCRCRWSLDRPFWS